MEKYGKIIEPMSTNPPKIKKPVYLSKKSRIYQLLIDYFKNPVFTKIKNTHYNSIYMAKIRSLLLTEGRYLVVLVPINNNPLGSKKPLRNLKWESFQTRTLEGRYNILTHEYESKSDDKFNIPINITKRDKEISTYKCDELNITVSLLHKKENNLYEYPDRGTILAALETYQTIISF
tara:strand:+ start:5517 stop:6047 length:531 start_codon:yes stop_codon:yes gene_type:complete